MVNFGQRIGQRPVREVVQTDSVDDSTRVALWNLMHRIESSLLHNQRLRAESVMKSLWATTLERPSDEYSWTMTEVRLKKTVLDADWVSALEVVEGFGDVLNANLGEESGDEYRRLANEILAKGLIGYRFIGSELAAVDDDQSASEIEKAIDSSSNAARTHLERAVSLLADRQNPQYAKVAGEAVLAVEAAVHDLTGKKTLGDGVKELGKRGLPVHPAILRAWSAMYGYTSDAGGIRHANINGEEVDAAMAVYLLVTCSAFVNLLAKVASVTKK
ncbi:hypothetical protein [Microbacterium sp. NPDC097977]|uniref:AbiJ-NTD4 domain-containing protein n=1 Tax=Microbacterium sp. NPDC097977 TaxID=3155686 RepID=UPI0033260BF6